MKTNIITSTLLLVAAAISYAAPVSKDVKIHVALEGYDPVVFFTESSAAKGNPGIQSKHEGAVYYFKSEENKQTFAKNPEKYLPAFGGYCAYGASVGALFPVDISTWEIVDGRLILQYNQEVKKLFNKDTKGNLAKADAYWKSLP